VEELKAEFKELAKTSHPDLAGPGSSSEAFAELRSEYEEALRAFAKYRFGARGASGAEAAPGARAGAPGPLGGEAWACLALFLKRGFPKAPRHEKEAARYEYARWRLGEALGPELAECLSGCERELLTLGPEGEESRGEVVGLLRELVEYREKGLPAMRTHILLALGSVAADPRIGGGSRSLLRGLAFELGIGLEIGDIPG